MDDKEFKQRLSEVAEWKIPDTSREISPGLKKKRGRKSEEDKYQEEHQEVFLEIFNGVNPTYAPVITKLKCQPVCCDDCGKICSEGRKVEAKHYVTNGKPHWRKHCVTCEHFQNPYTGDFDINNGTENSITWTGYLKTPRAKYKPKAKVINDFLVKKTDESLVVETEDGIITYNRDFHDQK